MYYKEGPTTREGGTKREQLEWCSFYNGTIFFKSNSPVGMASLLCNAPVAMATSCTCSSATLQTSPLACAWNLPVKLTTPPCMAKSPMGLVTPVELTSGTGVFATCHNHSKLVNGADSLHVFTCILCRKTDPSWN